MRRLRWGVAAAAGYLLVAAVMMGSGRPVLPLFDGLAPTPYRWVDPPEGFEAENQEPLGGQTRVPLQEEGAITMITDDGQAQVSILTEDVVLPDGQRSVQGTMTPLDPATLGPPPRGMRFDSNAYEAEVLYLPSREPLEFRGAEPGDEPPSATVLLRYAAHATRLARWDEATTSWTLLDATPLRGTLQIFSSSDELGVFVAVGPPRRAQQQDEGWPFWARWALYAAGGMAVVLAVELYLRRRRAAERKRPSRGTKRARR